MHPFLSSLSPLLTLFSSLFFFFFNDSATTEIYPLSLHDALPISLAFTRSGWLRWDIPSTWGRSEEHTSELQSRLHLVCRLLLEKKEKISIEISQFTPPSPVPEPRPAQTVV